MTGTTPPPTAGPRVTKQQVRDLSRLRRASDRPVLGGVCEGLSRHLDIDPLLIRVIFGALTVFGGAGIILYLLAWLTIPADNAETSWVSRNFHQDPERVMVLGLSLAAIVASIMLVGAIGFATPNPGAVITVSLVGLVLFALFTRRSTSSGWAATPPPAAPAPPAPPDAEADTDAPVFVSTVTPQQRDEEVRAWWQRAADAEGPSRPASPVVPGPSPPPRPPAARSRLTLLAVACMALALGGLWLADALGADINPSVYPGSVLGISATALLIGTCFGRAKLLIPLGLFSALVTVVFTVIGPGPYGERIYYPQTAASVDNVYEHGAGRMVLHLEEVRDLANLDGRTIHLDARVGEVEVIIPTVLDAAVTANVEGGDINGPTSMRNLDNGGEQAWIDARFDGRPHVTVDVDLTYGQIQIRRFDCPGTVVPQQSSNASANLSTLTWTGDGHVPAACN